MFCRTVLSELPLVLTPFVNCTIDERPETPAKLVPIAENKLSVIHFFLQLAGMTAKSLPFTIRVSLCPLTKIYRIYPTVWTSIAACAGELKQLKKSVARESISGVRTDKNRTAFAALETAIVHRSRCWRQRKVLAEARIAMG